MMVLLSDGIAPDSTKESGGVPKKEFKRALRRMAAPIFVKVPPEVTLDPMGRPNSYVWDRLRAFEGLIDDSGGRVLPAKKFETSDVAQLHSIVRGIYTLVVRAPDDFDSDAGFKVRMRGSSDLVVWHSGAGY